MSVGQIALVVVLPLYVVDLGNGVAAAALAFAMRSLGSVVVSVPAGVAISRYGHKAAMLTGTAAMAVSALVIATVSSSGVIAGATLAFGAGMGTWLLARLAYISQQVPNHQRGTALSALAGLQRLGMLLGPVVGGFAVEFGGYRLAFGVIAAMALLTSVLVLVFAPSASSAPSPPIVPPAASMVTLVPRILRRHRTVFMRAGVFVFCLHLLREQRRLLFVLWGTSIGVGVEDIGLIVSVASAADMAMFPAAGYIMDAWGRKVSGVMCIGIVAVAMAALPWTTSALAYLLVTVVSGIGNGLGSGIVLTMGSDLAPAEESNEFLGVWRTVGDLGSLAGPLLTSVVASLPLALGLSSIVGLSGGVVLLFFVKETLRSPYNRG